MPCLTLLLAEASYLCQVWMTKVKTACSPKILDHNCEGMQGETLAKIPTG